MKTRFNKSMKITLANLTPFVDDILEFWFVVDTEFINEHNDNVRYICQRAFLLVGQLVNENVQKEKMESTLLYMKHSHELALSYVGGEKFKEIHDFNEKTFEVWLEHTIKTLYESLS